MIEVAYAILDQQGEVLDFETLLKEIKDYLGFTAEKIKKNTSQFYTDLNINGSFISLGENRWGLRSWYPIDFIDEEVTQGNEDEAPKRKKRKKVSAFVSSEDEIDYSNDDPEDDDEEEEEDSEEHAEGQRNHPEEGIRHQAEHAFAQPRGIVLDGGPRTFQPDRVEIQAVSPDQE